MAEGEHGSCCSREDGRTMRRKVEEEELAQGRGSQMGCRAPVRSYCTRLQPGSLIRRWTDSHFPEEEEMKMMMISHH